jgi:hypothetical protein
MQHHQHAYGVDFEALDSYYPLEAKVVCVTSFRMCVMDSCRDLLTCTLAAFRGVANEGPFPSCGLGSLHRACKKDVFDGLKDKWYCRHTSCLCIRNSFRENKLAPGLGLGLEFALSPHAT